jgi:hypothetical protein
MAEKKVTEKDAAADAQDVQAKVDAAEERGFYGVEVDPTPRENYTLQTPQDAPTPENDPDQAAKVQDYQRDQGLT